MARIYCNVTDDDGKVKGKGSKEQMTIVVLYGDKKNPKTLATLKVVYLENGQPNLYLDGKLVKQGDYECNWYPG